MGTLSKRLLAVALLLAVAAGGWLALDRLRSPDGQVIELACDDPVAGCHIPEYDLTVRFDRPASAMQPFGLQVTLAGADQLHARFSMRDMEMGLNRYRLLPDGRGGWHANVILPVCVQGRHDWILELDTGNIRYRLPFSTD